MFIFNTFFTSNPPTRFVALFSLRVFLNFRKIISSSFNDATERKSYLNEFLPNPCSNASLTNLGIYDKKGFGFWYHLKYFVSRKVKKNEWGQVLTTSRRFLYFQKYEIDFQTSVFKTKLKIKEQKMHNFSQSFDFLSKNCVNSIFKIFQHNFNGSDLWIKLFGIQKVQNRNPIDWEADEIFPPHFFFITATVPSNHSLVSWIWLGPFGAKYNF